MNGVAIMDRPQQVKTPRVRMTPRDAQALEWLSQMYGAPLDVVAHLLSSTQKRAYALVKRWTDAGWADTGKPAAGPMWVWPKRQTAASYLGWDPGYWVPRPSGADHLRASGVTRLALGGDAEAWYPERQLRHEAAKRERGKTEPYLPDGLWRDQDGRWQAIEVELTSKGATRTREVIEKASASVGGRDSQASGVIYVCATRAIAATVTGAIDAWANKFGGDKGREIQSRFRIEMLSDLAGQVGLPATSGLIPTENERS